MGVPLREKGNEMTKKTKDELTCWLLVLATPLIAAAVTGLGFLIGRFFYISIPVLLIWDYIDTKKYGKNEWF